ncbi:peptide ABC transporter permease [Mesorhizobium soli]|uniref:Peptide ABC transporter permease n=2 Tax=Pseudaminobacter soli (ex Li et al. 2025) TaxID=1295366 RepID=A0A2P7S205_9HYPH|nr:peptide ABC transporter permease [Mesorhizobium soli]
MTALIAIGPLLAPYDPAAPVGRPYVSPSADAWLGTDNLGRDVLSRVLCGGVYLAWMAPISALLSVTIGTAIALVAAYRGGWVDLALMRSLDVLLAFPGVLLTLLCVSVFGPQPLLLVGLIVLTLMPGVARVIRGAALPLLNREYVLWAKAVGTPGLVIILRELLPNVSSPLLVELGLRLSWSVGILSSMSFIGYGIQPPAADWGLMVSENGSGLGAQPFAALAPIVMIVFYTIGGSLIAEGAARVIARTEGKA